MKNNKLSPLEALERLRPKTTNTPYYTKSERRYYCDIIEKSLKALEIIKERLDIGVVILGDKPKLRITFQNMLRFYDINQEEYDLLKEVLQNESQN